MVHSLESADETERQKPHCIFDESRNFVGKSAQPCILYLTKTSAGVCGIIRTTTVERISKGTDYSCTCTPLQTFIDHHPNSPHRRNSWLDPLVLNRTHSDYPDRHNPHPPSPLQKNLQHLHEKQKQQSPAGRPPIPQRATSLHTLNTHRQSLSRSRTKPQHRRPKRQKHPRPPGRWK
jgi:hypothetical protein